MKEIRICLDVQKNRGKEKNPLFPYSCMFLKARQGIKYKQNKRRNGFLGYLVIVLEKPSTTRAERSLALEKEQAIVIQNFKFFQRQKRLKIYAATERFFVLFFGEKRNFLSKERNLP